MRRNFIKKNLLHEIKRQMSSVYSGYNIVIFFNIFLYGMALNLLYNYRSIPDIDLAISTTIFIGMAPRKHLTMVSKIKPYKTSIRLMHRNAPRIGHSVIRLAPNPLTRRYYPGKFQAHDWNSEIKKNTHVRDDTGVSVHEATHTNITDTATNKTVAVLTSSKGNNQPGLHFEKISAVKVNGEFIPVLDPKTGKPLLDTNGTPIPNPNKGGQYLAVLQTPRQISHDAKAKQVPRPDIQAYLDTNEEKIRDIIDKGQKKTNANTRLLKIIGGKDDE